MMQTKISEILAYKGGSVYQVSPEQSVLEAIDLMNERRVGSVVVIRDGSPVGMFTERDVLTRIVPLKLEPDTTPVSQVMSTELVVISPDILVEDAMKVITEKKRRHLPVVTERRMVGLVSIGDLTRWLVREHRNEVETLLEYIQGPQPSPPGS